MAAEEKTCPYCAEAIKVAAIVCKHCGRDLPKSDGLNARALGVTWSEKDQRYMWRGSFFKTLEDASAYAAGNSATPGTQSDARRPERTVRWWMWPIGAAVIFVLWALLRTPSPDEAERNLARRAISLCWADHERKSLDGATKRFVADSCEKMESDFRGRWGMSP